MNFFQIIKPILFLLDPETAHNLSIKYLGYNLPRVQKEPKKYKTLENKVFGMNFSNPVGLAPGFDKNAQIFSNLLRFGFGFIECGTVTINPQFGNNKPRIFRLTEDKSIINRLGFNNLGIDSFINNLEKTNLSKIILGINIGKNRDQKDSIADYLTLIEHVYNYASYITINISSPNTQNLRNLQKLDQLSKLLHAINRVKKILYKENNKNTPILLKISPDLNKEEQEDIVNISLEENIDGLIISNTTIGERSKISSKYRHLDGGLSGKVLLNKSNSILSNIYNISNGKIPIIGVGGISSAMDAYEKIKLGASLIQIYTAFIFYGFELVEKIKYELDALIKADGFLNISDAIGVDTKKQS